MFDEVALRLVEVTNSSLNCPPRAIPDGLSGQSGATSVCAWAEVPGRASGTSAASASRTAAWRLRRNLPASAARRRNGKRQRGNPRRDGAAGEDSGGRRRDPEFSRGTARPGDGHDEGSRLSALGSRLSALGSRLSARLSALGSRLSALGSRLSALGSRLSALGSRLSALGSRLSALGSRLSALGSRLSLSALGSRLSALGSRLSALNYSATLSPRLGPGTPGGPGACARNRLRCRRRRSGPGARREPACGGFMPKMGSWRCLQLFHGRLTLPPSSTHPVDSLKAPQHTCRHRPGGGSRSLPRPAPAPSPLPHKSLAIIHKLV